MAMEINPLRSKDPEQPRDTIPSQLVDALLEDAEKLLLPGEENLERAVDTTQLSEFLQEAYGVEVRASSAHIEVTRFSCDLFITLNDGSHIMYRTDNGITDTTTEASVRHLITYTDSKLPELVHTKDMDTSEFVVFVRALDSLKGASRPFAEQ